MKTQAYSVDGRTFAFEAELTAAVPVGTYVRITESPDRSYFGQVSSVAVDRAGRSMSGTGSVLCQVVDGADGGEFAAPPGEPIAAGAEFRPADPDLLAAYLRSAVDGSAGLPIGTIQSRPTVPAVLRAQGFGRHTFLCGQSGSGKTYTLGVVLERLLLETDIRIVVLDPNSDFINMGSVQPSPPPEIDDSMVERFAAVAPKVNVFGGADSTRRLRARYGWLSLEQQTMVLGLDPLADAEEYNAFVRIVRSMSDPNYSLAEVMQAIRATFDDGARRLGLRIENLGIMDWSIWAGQDEPVMDALTPDWRMIVADLGNLPTATEASVAAAAFLGFLWEQRHARRPVVIVIDEAHNICPQKPSDENQALATEHVVRIAGEGRKFGKYLLLSTQRPDKVHENVLSQCDNLLLMRMSSHSDIRRLCDLYSYVPPGLVERATGFGLGEGVAAGKIAPNPLLFASGRRITVEGGSDVPSDWAAAR